MGKQQQNDAGGGSVPAEDTSKSTVFVRGIPTSATSKICLEAFFAEVGPVRQCFVVADSADKSKNRGFGFVHYAMPEDAATALTQLATTPFKNKVLSLELAKKRECADDRNAKKRQRNVIEDTATQVMPSNKKPKITAETTARLIVRNLSFKCTPAILKAEFEKFGTIKEATMPRKYEPNGPYRGFGMVQFTRRSDAQRALEALNEAEICGRAVAVDWCLPQGQFLVAEGVPVDEVKKRLQDKFAKGHARPEDEADMEEMADVDDRSARDRKPKSETVEEDDDDEDAMDEDGDDAEDAMDEDAASDVDSTASGSDNDDDDGNESDESDADPAARMAAAKRARGGRLPSADEGTTVFVRNVPFDATEEELRECFAAFGKLLYVLITRDKDTDKPKGTAFACFADRAGADACLTEAAKTNHLAYSMSTTASLSTNAAPAPAPVPSSSSLLTPELPSALHDSPLVLAGRLLNVTRAVDRTKAAHLTAKEKSKRERRDKRNLYLLREGFQGDVAERRTNLEKNLGLYVSRTRVSFRKLPPTVDERALRAYARTAASTYLSQVVATGEDDDWPRHPDLENPDSFEDESSERDLKAEVKAIRSGVFQAKVVRERDRVDSNGNLRSKGFGFVEFASHGAALACVRALLDSKSDAAVAAWKAALAVIEPSPKKKGKGKKATDGSDDETASGDKDADEKPIVPPAVHVEFAVENKQVVNMRDAKLKRQQKLATTDAKEPASSSSAGASAASSFTGHRGQQGRGASATRGRPPSGRGGSSDRGGRGGSRGGSRGGRGGGRGRGRGRGAPRRA
ncbi:RNA recognition motif-containing protein [Allomyces javanicus]|nr:RNA recognition motif-containing protein [Allomyces javanicus]